MKYVKTFEARRTKSASEKSSEIKAQEERRAKYIMDLKQEWEDEDEKSSVTFDAFFSKINLGYLTYPVNEFDEIGISIPDRSKIEGIYNSTGDLVPSNSIMQNDPDWVKRNAFFYTKVNTCGYSGGSCWDTGEDDGATYYETGKSLSYSEFLLVFKVFLKDVLYNFINTQDLNVLLEKLGKTYIIHEDSQTNYEYYGNSDTYQYYYIKFYDLWKFLSQNDCL